MFFRYFYSLDLKIQLYNKKRKKFSKCVFETMHFIINNKYNLANTKLLLNNYYIGKLKLQIIYIFGQPLANFYWIDFKIHLFSKKKKEILVMYIREYVF